MSAVKYSFFTYVWYAPVLYIHKFFLLFSDKTTIKEITVTYVWNKLQKLSFDSFQFFYSNIQKFLRSTLKHFSVTSNVVGLQTDDAGHVGQNSSAHVAHVVGLQTDAVVVTEARFILYKFHWSLCYSFPLDRNE